jgi:hypothetical protein
MARSSTNKEVSGEQALPPSALAEVMSESTERVRLPLVYALDWIGRAEEVASAALFLGSHETRHVAIIDSPIVGGITAV